MPKVAGFNQQTWESAPPWGPFFFLGRIGCLTRGQFQVTQFGMEWACQLTRFIKVNLATEGL